MIRDQPGRLADALRGWDHPPPGSSQLHIESFNNVQATLWYVQGDPERARQLLGASLSSAPRDPRMRLTFAYSDVTFGLCCIAEGNTAKVIAVLQPQLELAERELGRRSAVPAMLAAILAGALFLRDEPEQALETLADRLDVIERVALPEPIVVAYRVLAACALRRGEDARALEILEALRELGLVRDLPRLR